MVVFVLIPPPHPLGPILPLNQVGGIYSAYIEKINHSIFVLKN